MTAIAIWCNKEVADNPAVWVAADCRTSQTSSSASILIDDTAKVLSLPVVCKCPGTDGFFDKVSYATSLGYCFAGSTLFGQNIFLSLSALLSNISADPGYKPSLSDIASYTHRYLSRSFNAFRFYAGSRSIFEIALFGWCPVTEQLSVYVYRPELQDQLYQAKMWSYEGLEDREFIYLGCEKEHMKEAIAKGFSGSETPGRPLSRIPRYVIQDHMDNEAFPSIGGGIQMGIANKFGFQPLMLCLPFAFGNPKAYLSYLGQELEEDLAYVGDARVGGLAIS